jgi:hypothetical protein
VAVGSNSEELYIHVEMLLFVTLFASLNVVCNVINAVKYKTMFLRNVQFRIYV